MNAPRQVPASVLPEPPRRSPRLRMAYTVDVDGAARRVELPFVIGVFADLSGHPEVPLAPLADRGFAELAGAGVDALMRAVAPRLVLTPPGTADAPGGRAVTLRFECLADFLPDAIARRTDAARGVLDHPELRRLEASWRGLELLASRLRPDESLKVRVLDVSKKDLAKTLRRYRGAAWDQSPVFKKIYAEQLKRLGGEPFGCVVVDADFDQTPPDVELLGELAKIGAAAFVPFIGGASPSLMQMDSWQEVGNPRDIGKIFTTPDYAVWRSLREDASARYLALAMPRFLARDEAGADGARTWINAAYGLALVIGRSFKTTGWCKAIQGFHGGGAIDGLPFAGAAGSTEVAIDDRRADELVRAGLAVLIARSGTDIAAIQRAVTLYKPAEFDQPDATEFDRLWSQLSHALATCRLLHFATSMLRDHRRDDTTAVALTRTLNDWLANYVDAEPARSSALTAAQRPLAEAQAIVEEAGDGEGGFTARLFVR